MFDGTAWDPMACTGQTQHGEFWHRPLWSVLVLFAGLLAAASLFLILDVRYTRKKTFFGSASSFLNDVCGDVF